MFIRDSHVEVDAALKCLFGCLSNQSFKSGTCITKTNRKTLLGLHYREIPSHNQRQERCVWMQWREEFYQSTSPHPLGDKGLSCPVVVMSSPTEELESRK